MPLEISGLGNEVGLAVAVQSRLAETLALGLDVGLVLALACVMGLKGESEGPANMPLGATVVLAANAMLGANAMLAALGAEMFFLFGTLALKVAVLRLEWLLLAT